MIKKLTKMIQYEGQTRKMTVSLRFDDECKNGHDSFGITADIGRSDNPVACGCLHSEIRAHFPELAKYIKWHLTSTDGPLHYFANTIYWAEEGNLDYARSCAVWEDATLEQLGDKIQLADRLSSLMEEFKTAMEELSQL
jgi:hypothetical protein